MCILRVHKNDGESNWDDRIISFPFAHSVADSLPPFSVKMTEVVPFFQVQGAHYSAPSVKKEHFFPILKKAQQAYSQYTKK